MDDNLYPNDGSFFSLTVPNEQEKEHKTEEAEVLNASPILKTIIEHFDKRIAARDSIKSVQVDIAEDPELHQKACAVNDMVAGALRDEKSRLEALIKEYIPEK